ncbi:hypothetical protein [Paraburkholderia acidisoli]|uniref:Uncharacterized protein n=1 Tax=Paraburkholderia acidisoli TaxID=2571748 RepID=A0A7Z2GR84_9BURK|nr:hypothetical protein [Paraburkholderia acidisoli]QGZ66311.1 hypothetical protein FAZ98_31450 [Paraburkholderia acidisoli]QGZ66398.1 hypothetical protein FAZ98_31940 [Paraburkholderia acidisoli]
MYTTPEFEMACRINTVACIVFFALFVVLAILEMVPGVNNWLFSLFGGAL